MQCNWINYFKLIQSKTKTIISYVQREFQLQRLRERDQKRQLVTTGQKLVKFHIIQRLIPNIKKLDLEAFYFYFVKLLQRLKSCETARPGHQQHSPHEGAQKRERENKRDTNECCISSRCCDFNRLRRLFVFEICHFQKLKQIITIK